MSDQSPFSYVTAATVLLVACLLVAAVAPGAVAGGFIADDSETDDTDLADTVTADSAAAEPASTDPAAVDSRSAPGSDAVAPGLRSANGTVEVVVRFGSDARLGADGGGADGSGGSATLSANDLKTNAANAQADFETFAERKPGVAVERSFWLANAMLVTVDTESVAVERLLEVRGVERVHENFEVELDSTATDGDGGSRAVGPAGPPSAPASGAVSSVSTSSTGTDATYGVDMVRAPEVWEVFGTRGEGATVAVIDTGVDPNHPDLNVSGWAEYDAEGNLTSDNLSDATDGNGHGTHVAGTVAGGNASGTAIGVAPNASLHGIKVFDDDGTNATFARVTAGMEHATQDPDVDVLQMSLGADGYVPSYIEPVRNARSAGKIVVVSSGNSGQGTSSSPGNVYDSLAVGAVDDSRSVADFSGGETINTSNAWKNDAPADWPNEYAVPDISAPGVSVGSSLPGDKYGYKSGTSMAAPHVSGVAALVLSASTRKISDDELYDTLRDTANHPANATDPDDRYGTGIVDGYAAVSSVAPLYRASNFTAPELAERGEPLNATVDVTNDGEVAGDNRTVEFRLVDPGNASNVSVVAAENVSLGSGNTKTLSLNGTVPSAFGTGETTVTVASPEDAASAPIRIADAVGTINGSVTDAETDAPLAGIDVVVEDGTEVVGATVTGTEGTYAVDVPATELTVAASNATYAPANQTVALTGSGDTATANFSLALRNGTLTGTVGASDGLDHPSNATVTVRNETGEVVAAIDAAGDGTYATELRPGTYDATADAPEFENRTTADVAVSPNATASEDFALTPRPASLSGTVTNGTDGGAISGATVTIGGDRTATTDANGTYALDALDRGEREITVSADGYARESRTLTLAANDTRDLNVSLSPRGVFIITNLSGDTEIEQGSSGSFGLAVQNDGRVTDDASVDISLNRSGSVSPDPVSIDGVAVGDSESKSFSVSLGSSAPTGTYAVTAATPDSEKTHTFVAVGGSGGSRSTDGGGGGGDGGGDGGGGDDGGGGGGGGGGGQPSPPADDTDDEPENATDEPENVTDEPENVTDEPENVTDEPENVTDEPTNETNEPVGDGPADGGDENNSGESGDDDAGEATDGGSEGDGGADGGGSADGAPGFGPAVGVVAVLAAALLVGRRRGRGGGE